MKSSTKIFRRRIYHSPGELVAAASEILHHSPDIKSARRSGTVNRAFAEKIMLAVTQVNDCRYCRFGHTKAALEAGVSEDEITRIARGDLAEFPQDETPGLLYAQHFAETGGAPDPAETTQLVNFYGEQTAAEIGAYIRMITAGNLLGNTFDALLSRFRRRPAPDSSVISEFSTLLLAAIGVIPFGIIFGIRLL